MSTATGFTVGQRVRLIAPYTGRCMTYREPTGIYGPKPPVVLASGAVFTVFKNTQDPRLTARCQKTDPEAVLVRNETGTWCIPARLLELAPDDATVRTDSTEQPNGKEPCRDAEGARNG